MEEYVKYTPAQLTAQYNHDLSTLPQAIYNEKGLPREEQVARYEDAIQSFNEKYKDDFFISKNIGKIIMNTTKGINGHPKGLLFMNGNKQYVIDKDKDEPIIYRRAPQSKKRSRSHSALDVPPPPPSSTDLARRGGKKNRKTKRRKSTRRNKNTLQNNKMYLFYSTFYLSCT